MKQTNVGEGCNFEVITFDYISISLKDIFLKCQQNVLNKVCF